VLRHPAVGINAAYARARILALVVDAGQVGGAVIVLNAFKLAADGGIAKVSRKTGADTPVAGASIISVLSARVGFARVSRSSLLALTKEREDNNE
jgi:hypothetical protein